MQIVDPVRLNVRDDFPILRQSIDGHPLVYLDSAASTQKPKCVIEAISDYYRHDHANVHRGVHTLSQRATDRFESARRTIQRFLSAASENEIIFTKGCTEAINLVAGSWGRANLNPGDEIVLTQMEHHANIVPWQIVCKERGATIKVAPIDDRGELLLDQLPLSEKTKFVGAVHVSNALGTINPIAEIVARAHEVDAVVLVDGAQATAHQRVDVQELGVDFYTLSGHKLYGPTGIGCLYGKARLLNAMPPYQAGGDMIRSVSFEETTYNDIPNKFEPGTPHISGAIGLAAAIDYVEAIGLETIETHERELANLGAALLSDIEGLRLIGTSAHKAGILSFVIDGIHPHDIGTVLDQQGIAIRTGHHCCMPLMKRLGLPATARASLGIYNTREDLERLVHAVIKVKQVFA